MHHDISGLSSFELAERFIGETELRSERIKELAEKGFVHPRTLTQAEIKELCASIVDHIRQERIAELSDA
jgi:hypothetical protein